jgi:hypothetical protein
VGDASHSAALLVQPVSALACESKSAGLQACATPSTEPCSSFRPPPQPAPAPKTPQVNKAFEQYEKQLKASSNGACMSTRSPQGCITRVSF